MLVPAYFSPNYNYFDQLLQTVKNKTTVLILVLKEFLQTSIPPLLSIFYARLFVQSFLSHSTEKFRWGTIRRIKKFRVAKNFMHLRRGWGYHDFPS